jgi:hypothetical protein
MEMINEKVVLCRKKLIAIAFLNFSDWLCTLILLKNDGFFEVNPIMSAIMDNPLLCFGVKCVLPLILISYIYYILPHSNFSIVRIVNIIMMIISIFYIIINLIHIFNLILLIFFQ